MSARCWHCSATTRKVAAIRGAFGHWATTCFLDVCRSHENHLKADFWQAFLTVVRAEATATKVHSTRASAQIVLCPNLFKITA
jgi:hypothetical protein